MPETTYTEYNKYSHLLKELKTRMGIAVENLQENVYQSYFPQSPCKRLCLPQSGNDTMSATSQLGETAYPSILSTCRTELLEELLPE